MSFGLDEDELQEIENTMERNDRFIAFSLLVTAGLLAIVCGCGPLHATPIIQPDPPKPVAADLKIIDDKGQSILDTAKIIKTEVVENQAKIPAATPLLLTIGGQADHIVSEATALDTALTSAQVQDAKNTTAVKELQGQVFSLTKQNTDSEAKVVKLQTDIKSTREFWIRLAIASVFSLGLLCWPGAIGVWYFLRELQAAIALVAAGIMAMSGALLGQALMRLQTFFVWALGTAIIVLLVYGVYLALSNMKRKFAQVVETASAFSKIDPSNGAAMADVAKAIQDADTTAHVLAVKHELALPSLPDPKSN